MSDLASPRDRRALGGEPVWMPASVAPDLDLGQAWAVDAYECRPDRLRSVEVLDGLFRAVVAEAGLRPVREAIWHPFPAPGGVTGFLLLSESHLAVHTFPERGFCALDLYCCRPRPVWRWEEGLAAHLGARRVVVRAIPRGGDAT